ncbi:hypothetical protein BCR35DRAFT_307588 [Leucosporidium creatinivorum]|uniref:MYND-type domain-containing protein n=1 Tax=Leucosporidium creatinivorum TaxID=106004 RepID=A0A1Y2ENZ4_9BASI|nr:hypothetical protein BCR35DRAFT_307588 [Leucosporidium creatinivorum]
MSSSNCSACGKSEAQLGGAKLSRCSRCLSTQYCGRECQTSSWAEHKGACKRIANERAAALTAPAPTEHPFDAFPPFVDSILLDALSVLQIPYFKDLYGPERKPLLFHLHFQVNPTPANARRKFNLKSARDSTPPSFINWVRSIPEMQERVVESYRDLLEKFDVRDKLKVEGMTADERDHEPAAFRFACTAERADGSFLGIRFVTGTVRTRTRSGCDPLNADLPIFPPLKAVLDQADENELAKDADGGSGYASSLLVKITKAFVKNDVWAQRAEDAFEKARHDGSNENWALMHACRKTGVDEKVLLGGRHGAAYVYAVAVPEWPTPCTCGESHGPEGHLEEESDEEDDGEYEEEAGGHPGHSEGGHGGHSHSHGGQACGGHSH